MKRVSLSLSSHALVLALLSSAPAGAQGLVEEIPPEYSDGPVTGVGGWATTGEQQVSPYHRERLRDTLRPSLEAGGVLPVAGELVRTFREDSWSGEHAALRDRILSELDALLLALDGAVGAPGIEGLVDTEEEQGIFLDALREQGRGVETLRPFVAHVDGIDVVAWFSEDDPLFLYEYDEEVSASVDADLYRLLLPSQLARRWGLLADTLSQLLEDQIALLRARNVRDLERAVTRWDNYLERGYSQYPWESLANGWLLTLPELGPPRRQWILFHPALGVEAGGRLDELRVKEALNIELIGHLWYTRERDNYYGISLATSLREDLDPGIGVLLHFRRNWNLGVTWHQDEDDPYFFMSLDLYAFARREHARFESRRRWIQEQLEAL